MRGKSKIILDPERAERVERVNGFSKYVIGEWAEKQ